MTFITDKEELKAGLIIFRRADVAHRNWYCRIKLPKADRYKTVSLKTSDIPMQRVSAPSTMTPTCVSASSMAYPFSTAPSAM